MSQEELREIQKDEQQHFHHESEHHHEGEHHHHHHHHHHHYNDDDRERERKRRLRCPECSDLCYICAVKDIPNFKFRLTYDEKYCMVKTTGRRPTDCAVLILFIAFLVGMVIESGYSMYMGDPRRLLTPIDYLGRYCGRDNTNDIEGSILLPRYNECMADQHSQKCKDKIRELGLYEDLSDRPYLWFMDISQPLLYGGVCVEYCPRSKTARERGSECPDSLVLKNWTDSYIGFFEGSYCEHTRFDNGKPFPPTEFVIALESKINYEPILGRCIPSIDEGTINRTVAFFSSEIYAATQIGTEIIGDVVRGWIIMVICAIMAVTLSYCFLFVLRVFACPVIWITVILCFFALAAVSGLLTYFGLTKRNELLDKDLDTFFADLLWYSGIGFGILSIVYAFVVAILFGKIRRAIGILQEATRAVSAVPQVVLLPLCVFVLLFFFYGVWIIVAIWMYSAGDPKITDYTVHYKWDNIFRGIGLYHMFGFFWVTEFLEAFTYCVIAGVIASWYWSRDKGMFKLRLPLLKAVGRTLLFHMGSLAFGSLIVAIIQMLRYLMKKVYNKLTEMLQQDKIVRSLIWLTNLSLKILETIIKYVNKHAYIQIAIYGTAFIPSARNAMLLFMRNAAQIAVVEWIGTAILFIAKLCISLICVASIFGLEYVPFLIWGDTTLHIPILVVLVVFVTSYLISSVFMTILECAIDTILQSFLMDQEMCEDNPKAQPFCTNTLKLIIEENKKIQQLSKCFGLCDCCLDTGGGCCNTCI